MSMIQIPNKEFKTIEVMDPSTNEMRGCFLVKYEKRTYNTIRIGTLSYYRDIEGNQGDPLDGRVEGVVFKPGKKQPVTREEMLHISGGSLDIVARDGIIFGETGSYQDEKSRRCHNVYIYCCSMEFGVFPNNERMKHFGAKEFFVIDNTAELREVVARELQRKARTLDGKPFTPERHYLKSWEAPVRYKPRKIAEIELPINNLDFFIYQKDPKYIIEQEYRFTWIFFDRETDKPVEVSPEPIDIPRTNTWRIAHVKKL